MNTRLQYKYGGRRKTANGDYIEWKRRKEGGERDFSGTCHSGIANKLNFKGKGY